MKIEHIAIWVKDIDKVCEFYRKYFDGVVHPIYHNPAKQFTSRFVTFDDGARLEIMHRPDICVGIENVWTVTSLQSNTHRSANEKMRAFFRFLTSAVFHVKPLQGECSAHTCMGITEPQEVGHKVSKQLQTEEAAGNSFTDISEVQQVGSEGANTIAKPDTQHLGFTHLSFSVGSKEEVDHLTQQMSSEGVPVVGQPRTTGDGYYESVVLDPEGNRIEITI
ncbi:VOC family protein [Fibrobacter sp. UWB7]|uniref:VOC family protein n=1 Tax=Fibrobacter sp. UWB7 TaxID=1896206 RepID=UPI00091672A9|nr:VOC family protein [Fibrobacter sp. UWB7]SHN01430.1 Glyoxalase/Bleomycin resistance protein/Dioxygenase superfamily protein [Fibrobacter sp. UWB7]